MTDGHDSPYDTVAALPGSPTVVSLSDVHGHLDRARSALLTLSDHGEFEPVVEAGVDGRLHWAGNDYVLVFNGDLIDRGPDSEECVALARRLREEAPTGRVRYLLGNHETFLLQPPAPERDRWYCDRVGDEERRRFYDEILAGEVTVAYEGYEHTFVHAGAAAGVDAAAANEALWDAATQLRHAVGTDRDAAVHSQVFREFDRVFMYGDDTVYSGRGPTAGILWLDFQHLPGDAPPQVVGHSRHEEVTRDGNVVCGDVVLDNVGSPGGEAVVVETPTSLWALARDADGGVTWTVVKADYDDVT
ncbi:metallophosphoesterase [Haloarchaeobius sp. HRN-SO-5]|uniref:metallophosphoesterase n=1 Tax=Haloarchaeobius sp. HRN-SO-5 TaxID=3446118 RepID=UPI003EBF9995